VQYDRIADTPRAGGATGAIMLKLASRSMSRLIARGFARQIRARFARPLGASDLFNDEALRVVLAGTSSPLPDARRAKSSVVVIAGGRAYVVDTGPESWKTLALMNFPGARIAAILLTHFHSDHIGDLGEFRMQTWVAGRRQPLPVFGPEGVAQVVAGFNQAYALDDGYRAAHHGEALMPLQAAPLEARTFAASDQGRSPEALTTVLKDGDLTISTFEVDHAPASPAAGYRFDYRGRSVVVSGDTKKIPAVAAAAQGADVLIHDALSQTLRQLMVDAAREAGIARVAKLFADIGDYHASPIEAAETANEAGARLLVYTHFVPPLQRPQLARAYFDGVEAIRPKPQWIVGFDGLRIDLPLGTTEVVQGDMRSAMGV
jgi:ribonuclease Z